LPFGFYVTYENGGPQYRIFDFDDKNRAEWHKDKAIELLENQSYEALIEWANQEPESTEQAYESVLSSSE
jgi:hypothetical protein